jgi:hypothetical protein
MRSVKWTYLGRERGCAAVADVQGASRLTSFEILVREQVYFDFLVSYQTDPIGAEGLKNPIGRLE